MLDPSPTLPRQSKWLLGAFLCASALSLYAQPALPPPTNAPPEAVSRSQVFAVEGRRVVLLQPLSPEQWSALAAEAESENKRLGTTNITAGFLYQTRVVDPVRVVHQQLLQEFVEKQKASESSKATAKARLEAETDPEKLRKVNEILEGK